MAGFAQPIGLGGYAFTFTGVVTVRLRGTSTFARFSFIPIIHRLRSPSGGVQEILSYLLIGQELAV